MDWQRIRTEFASIRNLLEEMPGPISEQELDSHRVSSGLGLPSTLAKQLDFDYRAYHGSVLTKERLSALKNEINCYDTQFLIGEKDADCFETIERSINSENCSTEFVLAWGHLNQLFGRFIELMQQADSEKTSFERNEKAGASRGSIVQRYWHAHWVIKNSGTDRKTAESELAELCADIWQGRLIAPPGYEAKWFETLISGELGEDVPRDGNSDGAILKTTYTRAKQSDLEAMARNPDVKPETLPPLERIDFRTP